jgi:transcriptional regulator with XRE-family HTH domain
VEKRGPHTVEPAWPFGAALREARTAAGLTTAQLGAMVRKRRVACDHSVISRWETGARRSITVAQLEALASALGLSEADRKRWAKAAAEGGA